MISKNAMPEGINRKLKKTDWLIISGAWLLLQLIFLKNHGIFDQEEAPKYILLAQRWMRGDRNFNLYNLFYSGYISIYVLLETIGFNYKAMYGVQLIFSWLSVYYFVKILSLFIQVRIVILSSVLLYATCYIIQLWVSILFTDSIFSSLLIIATYFLLTEQKGKLNACVFWTLLICLPFFRPVGFLFIAIACSHWMMDSLVKNAGKIFSCFCYVGLIGIIVYRSFTQSQYFYPIHSLHNIQANVICGYPGNLLKYQEVPFREGMSVYYYLLHNPNMTLRLFFSRFVKVFSMGRPYFSPVHNLLLLVSTFVYYTFAILGVAELLWRKEKKLYFLIVGIMIFALPMVIFCVEWSGRFSLPVICYVLLLSSLGIERVMNSLPATTRRLK